MFKQILIANRGEIALRVLRACRELGIETVVAYSEADRDSLPVRLADKRICIGPAHSSKSYLNIPNLISAALLTGCEAIHPGHGFLSENASFAEVCRDVGIVFIGPSPEAIVTMGDKVEARLAMERAGLPMLPGTAVLRTLGEGEVEAARVGFPLMLKAARAAMAMEGACATRGENLLVPPPPPFTPGVRHAAVPGSGGSPARSMARRASTLSPMVTMASGDRPMKTMPTSQQTSAKLAFSERKP